MQYLLQIINCVCFIYFLDDEKSEDDNNQESPAEIGDWRCGDLINKSISFVQYIDFSDVIFHSLYFPKSGLFYDKHKFTSRKWTVTVLTFKGSF